MTAFLLGVLGLTLSLVAPGPLARARWTSRAPAAAVVLWQCLTLAGVLSAVGVVLAAPEELIRASGSGRAAAVAALVGALAVAALIVVRLLASLAGVSRRSRARRAWHRSLVDLLDSAEQHGHLGAGDVAAGPGKLRVLDGPVPFAYCLPGRSPRVVLSGEALRVLTAEQVAAVLAHEQAHLRGRHDLVLESFTAFYRAAPRPLRRRAPLDAVHLLVEMLADDAARRRCGAAPLRAALATLGDAADTLLTGALVGGVEPPAGGADAERDRRRRLERLVGPEPAPSHAGLGAVVYAAAAGLLVLPTALLVAPWLIRALPAWPL